MSRKWAAGNTAHARTPYDLESRPKVSADADNRVTQTLYSVAGQRVAGQANVQAIAAGGQQITKIDALDVATESFYDASGRFTDLWQPPVTDADVASATY